MAAPGDQSVERKPDWYEFATDDLEQGDVLIGLSVLVPTITELGEVAVLSKTTMVVVLTQSCDIPKVAQQTLLLVQAIDYQEALKSQQHLGSKDYKNGLASGTTICDFLLPPDSAGQIDYTLVHFRNLFVLPKSYVQAEAAKLIRLRLRSPYKEHFAQAYARFMMRVGLPHTLHDFTK